MKEIIISLGCAAISGIVAWIVANSPVNRFRAIR